MYWENIEGWFSYKDFYDSVIGQCNKNAVFVEIGVWKGKSAVYMAERIKELKKTIAFYAIDPFTGFGEEYKDYEEVKNGTLVDIYYKNIEPIKSYIQTIKDYSYNACKKFEDESIDFVFIDGDHTYEGVKRDLIDWFPKIKIGGLIAGHDYEEVGLGVKQAVDEFFVFKNKKYIGGCFYFEKNNSKI